MKIDVTQEDIDNGKRGHCSRCPVALALSRIPGAEYLTVGPVDFGITLRGVRRDYALPEEAIVFIRTFDDGEITPNPFSFEIEL